MTSPLVDKVPSTPLPSILNFRDVGKTVNILHDSPFLQEGLIYRSARPDDASPADRSLLTDDFQIRTVIDLRSTTELIEQAKKRDASARIDSSVIAPRNEQKAANAIKIPGINYQEINVNGGAFARALLWKLRWTSLAKVTSFMVIGYRTEAISILGREVMAPRGLIGMGKDTLDYCFTELARILTVFANQENYPILTHCTQGKDRTGLVVVLLLLLLDVPLPLISADYVASKRELEIRKESRMKEIEGIGLGDEFAGCPEGFVGEVAEHIKQKHGGISEYLEKIGVDEEAQERIRNNLRRS